MNDGTFNFSRLRFPFSVGKRFSNNKNFMRQTCFIYDEDDGLRQPCVVIDMLNYRRYGDEKNLLCFACLPLTTKSFHQDVNLPLIVLGADDKVGAGGSRSCSADVSAGHTLTYTQHSIVDKLL